MGSPGSEKARVRAPTPARKVFRRRPETLPTLRRCTGVLSLPRKQDRLRLSAWTMYGARPHLWSRLSRLEDKQMSKVIHLSDQAHNAAKAFCRQHSLKMSDWVADLILDAINNNRVDPRVAIRSMPSAPVATATTTAAPTATVSAPAAPKKKLERIPERNGSESVPPWAAPPFWAKPDSKSS